MKRNGNKKVSLSGVGTKRSLWMLIKRNQKLQNCNKSHWYIFCMYICFYRIKYFKTAGFFFNSWSIKFGYTFADKNTRLFLQIILVWFFFFIFCHFLQMQETILETSTVSGKYIYMELLCQLPLLQSFSWAVAFQCIKRYSLFLNSSYFNRISYLCWWWPLVPVIMA